MRRLSFIASAHAAARRAATAIASTLAAAFRDRRGTIGVTAAGVTPVLIVLVGAAVDYSRAEAVKSKLQHAADTAALAVSNAQLMQRGDQAVQVRPFLDANIAGISGMTIQNVDLQENGDGFARVTVDADIENFFLDLVGLPVWDVRVVSQVEYRRPQDIDITIVVDNSPSMLIGASVTDIANMEADFGCAFACHYPDHWGNTYDQARDRGYDTRLDAATNAILRSFDIARDSAFEETADIYFDVKTFARTLDDIGDGLPNAALEAAVRGIRPVPRPAGSDIYTMTDPETALQPLGPEIAAKLAAFPEREHFVLLVTDGVTDYRRGGRLIHEFRSEYCDALKATGVRIGVIYTTYLPIPSNGFWRSNVDPIDENIAPNLRACASPGWYFEAAFEDDINEAFEELMRLAIPRPQLTL